MYLMVVLELMGDEEAFVGDFSDNKNNSDDVIVKTKIYGERRGRS